MNKDIDIYLLDTEKYITTLTKNLINHCMCDYKLRKIWKELGKEKQSEVIKDWKKIAASTLKEFG